ncbi:FAD-dependent monooxygenase [Pseudomonas antarctica]|uniref:FAD-dependent monooxygenase n=1 Tax=Pseudomonas antarctica TaxID=219572 RepID=UPI0039C18EBC
MNARLADHYRVGQVFLVGDAAHIHPPTAHRVPDARLRGAAGQSLRSFDVFKGTHWTLLGYGVTPGSRSPRAGLHVHCIGPYGEFIDELYALAIGEWVLVRPDGYIGAFFSPDSIETLEDY